MLLNHSIIELAKMIKTKQVSLVEITSEALAKIESLDQKINSFISVKNPEEILAEAKAKQLLINEQTSLLFGIPFSLKDAYITKNLRTTAASRVLDNYQPPFNATVYQKLVDKGAILIGKNNMDAWGHGASNENTDYQAVKNPWDDTRIAGGSSGGSAAAVVNRMVNFAIGEDTGGSIRNPSSMCNVSGLKVTYGRVSRFGAIAYASSLDTIGPIAKSVEDLAVLLQVMAGHDPLDSSSSNRSVDNYQASLSAELKNKIVGIPQEFFGEGLDPEVKKIVLNAIKELENLGVKTVEVNIPFMKHSISIYYMIAASETSSNLARYDGIRFGLDRANFTDETARRIMLGTYALSAGYADKLYKNAQKARTVLVEEYNKAFSQCDILVGPVMPMIPPKLGELINDPLQNMLSDLYTTTINIVGVPSLAIPAGFSQNGLPIGIQLIGKKFHEAELLNFGYKYQQITDWHKKMPKLIE